jgi:hypothetical protein
VRDIPDDLRNLPTTVNGGAIGAILAAATPLLIEVGKRIAKKIINRRKTSGGLTSARGGLISARGFELVPLIQQALPLTHKRHFWPVVHDVVSRFLEQKFPEEVDVRDHIRQRMAELVSLKPPTEVVENELTPSSIAKPILAKAFELLGEKGKMPKELKIKLDMEPMGEGIIDSIIGVLGDPAVQETVTGVAKKALPIAKKLLGAFRNSRFVKKRPKLDKFLNVADKAIDVGTKLTTTPSAPTPTAQSGPSGPSASGTTARGVFSPAIPTRQSSMVYGIASDNGGEDVSSI